MIIDASRLLPKNARYLDGKRHVKVVPVKLSRPQNNLRKKHVHCHFAMASVKPARELASLLLDHGYPIGEKHKLIPSVYAACEKNKDSSIGYNGQTYRAIGSRKHDKSSAASHVEDFRTLLPLE